MTPPHARKQGARDRQRRVLFRGTSANGRFVISPRASSPCPQRHRSPAPAAGATRTRCQPRQPHSFTRVTVPGTDKELDYVSVAKGADVVKAFPKLGWVDSLRSWVTPAAPASLYTLLPES